MKVAVRHWDEARHGPVSVAAIRTLHQPAPERFEIYPRVYEPGMSFPLVAQGVRVYVLNGICEYAVGGCDGQRLQLRSGDVADLTGGFWWFEVVGSEPAEVVRVFDFGALATDAPDAAPDPACDVGF